MSATATATAAEVPAAPAAPAPPAAPKARSRRSRVRSNSDEIPRLVQGQVDASYYESNQTAQHMMASSPQNSHSAMMSSSPTHYGQARFMHPPPSPQFSASYLDYMNASRDAWAATNPPLPSTNQQRNHARTNSWSGPPPVMYPPSPRMEAKPLLQHPQVMPGQQQQQQQLPRRSYRRRGRHRKSYSSSEAVPGSYGAFWDHPAQSERNTAATNMGGFSPRGDFNALTSSLRSNGTSPLTIQHPSSPGYGAMPSPAIARSWSAGAATLPSTPLQSGGEAVFLAQSTRKARPESQRRMHRRQLSAQILVEDFKGQEQPRACRDVTFLLVFVFHLLFVGYIGTVYGKQAIRTPSLVQLASNNHTLTTTKDMQAENQVTIYYQSFVYIACLSGPFAVALSALLLSSMTLFARHFIQVALMIAIGLSFIWGTIGIGLSPKTAVPITGIITLALTVAYAFIVWDRIPFSAANLLTALSGVHANPGTIVVAFFFQALALAWSIYYAVVVCGVYDSIQNGSLQVAQDYKGVIYTLLGVSYYWTFQVLQNTVQVTTANVIGGWWHNPEEQGVVRKACFTTFFYNMGCICFGSLFVGPVRLLRQLSGFFRPQAAEQASLMCLHQCMNCIQKCVSSFSDALAKRFNSWGFTYVGLYGYGFMEASSRSAELFEKRGWTVIVSDDLVPNILLMTSLVIGGVTGCFAHLISQIDGLQIMSVETNGMASFIEGVVIGIVLTSVLFAVISSSVNTVIVCFAASPVDFENKHPELSHEMRSAWREVWPGALDVVDMRATLPGMPPPVVHGSSPLV